MIIIKRHIRERMRWQFLLSLILGIVVFTGCMKEGAKVDLERMDQGEMTISLQISRSEVPTRALTDALEDKIVSIDVLAFGEDNKLVRHSKATNISPFGNKLTFKVWIPFGKIKLVFLANAESWIIDAYSSGTIPDNTTYQEISTSLKKTITPGVGWIADETNPAYLPIPMFHETSHLDINALTDFDLLQGNDALILKRTIAKVEVYHNKVTVPDFELVSATIFRYDCTGFLFKDVYKTQPSSKSLINQSIRSEETTVVGNVTQITHSLYLFEADNPPYEDDGNGEDVTKHEDRIALVIGGHYKNDPTVSYYRVDFRALKSEGNAYLSIYRNGHYKVNITSVDGPGWPDEDLAYHGYDADIVIELLDWEDGTLPGDSGWL